MDSVQSGFETRAKQAINRSRFTIPMGILSGILVYVASFAAVARNPIPPVYENVLRGLDVTPNLWRTASWVVFNAHRLDTYFGAGYFHQGAGPLIYNRGYGFTPVLLLVPPLLLFAVGFVLGRTFKTDSREESLILSVGVSLGYLIFLVALSVIAPLGETGVGRPVPYWTLFAAGIIYPGLFASLGSVTDLTLRRL